MRSIIKFLNPIAILAVTAFILLIIYEPETCTKGACEGIFLCGRVIIPALFPFTVCVLFILKSGILRILNFTAPFTRKVFKFSPEVFPIMLLSFTGGYPIGAKLINEMVILKKIDSESAGIMLNFCINAGPAFVILAVGNGIIGSKAIGYILLASHIVASFLLALFFGRFIRESQTAATKKNTLNAVDNFVISTSDAASTVINVCAYVILFSTINSYIELISAEIKPLNYLSYILEVTNAVRQTNNVLIISFLLGFGGICVWCQIISLGRKIKINMPLFILSRIFHGIISSGITLLFLKIFNFSVSVFSNTKIFSFDMSYSTLTLSISMLCMIIIFIISLYTKKYAGKILEDLI